MEVDHKDGRYDEDAEAIFRKYMPGIDAALVIVVGERCGFSMAAQNPIFVEQLPKVLRNVASIIEHQVANNMYIIEPLNKPEGKKP